MWKALFCFVNMQIKPFKFLAGQYTEELYDEQVEVCAPGFKTDDELRARVREAATGLLQQLETSSGTAEVGTTSFEHKKLITFDVQCGIQATG